MFYWWVLSLFLTDSHRDFHHFAFPHYLRCQSGCKSSFCGHLFVLAKQMGKGYCHQVYIWLPPQTHFDAAGNQNGTCQLSFWYPVYFYLTWDSHFCRVFLFAISFAYTDLYSPYKFDCCFTAACQVSRRHNNPNLSRGGYALHLCVSEHACACFMLPGGIILQILMNGMMLCHYRSTLFGFLNQFSESLVIGAQYVACTPMLRLPLYNCCVMASTKKQ